VFQVWQALRTTGEKRLLEIQQVVHTYLQEREKMEPVTAEQLVQRLEEGGVVVLDVRPTEEYQAGHIPGALSVAVAELKRRLKELPRSKEIVAYCRGPYCVQSDAAVELLTQ
jgi:rhodanese-related sulfurtransferase